MMEDEILKVAAIFQNLGADVRQAKTMSRQLIKRAEQLCAERNTTKVEELQKLLEVAVLGAKGETKPLE